MSRHALLAAALCSSLAIEAASLEVQVRDAAGAAVVGAAVYAMPPTGPADARGARASIEQRDREFVPFVTILQAGTAVSFPNRDPILHHVYSFSPPKPFEIKLYSGTPPGEIVFDKPGIVTLGCNIHDWMIAYILVVQTPHFARTDKDGVALLRDLPAGAYEVRAYHPHQRAALGPQRASLGGQSAERLAFVLDTSPKKPRYRPPLDRAKY